MAIKPVSGREFIAQSGEKAIVTHKLTMRARDDFRLAPRDRLLFGTRIFNIRAVLDEMEGGRDWELMASEELHTTDD